MIQQFVSGTSGTFLSHVNLMKMTFTVALSLARLYKSLKKPAMRFKLFMSDPLLLLPGLWMVMFARMTFARASCAQIS